jgi:TRAP-type C4-dicarboxylate transport system permease large subunit
VIYAILTEDSIGRLFMAGILPGLLLIALFMGTVWLIAWRDPAAGRAGRCCRSASASRCSPAPCR